jgi:hypothetical protein
MKDLIGVLTQGTMLAAVSMVYKTNRFPYLKALGLDSSEVISGHLRETLKKELPACMAEWRSAVEANLSESWLRECVNLQCNKIALEALKEAEAEV